MTYVINGPTNGNGVIFGNSSGSDIINAEVVPFMRTTGTGILIGSSAVPFPSHS